MAKNHVVEMPEQFLLRIAVYGDMGDGKLGDFMRVWARQECTRLGLNQKVSQGIEENLQGLRKRASNILGGEVVDEIEKSIERVVPFINKAMEGVSR